ncbi:MAG: aminotransferase class V-fold PLP-dependent enzyme [Thermomicrobiales bacterium]
MVTIFSAPAERETDIYARLGVRTIINARGATTAVGGTLPPPEVLAAMAEAAKAFVVLDELNAAVGEKIAAATGAEAGYVTAGSAAGMLLAVAACITGTDIARIRRLPDTTGMPDEVIVHRAHRINYDQMFRAPGAKLVEIGIPSATERWEYEAAFTERTAAVAFVDSPSIGPGALDFSTVVAVAHARNVPVIVDAASTLPPVSHLTRWIAGGADLVIYSGGKGIRGPQDSGLLAGRADLIAAAKLNGNPNAGIGRAAKVSKEAMVGLAVALDRFIAHDHDADFAAHRAQAELIAHELADFPNATCEVIADPERYPMPLAIIRPVDTAWSAPAVRATLAAGDPGIFVNAELGGIGINTHCLREGDAEQIATRLRALLRTMV